MTPQEMGKLRWYGVGPRARRRLTKRAAQMRMRGMTSRERSALARRAAIARWHKLPDLGTILPDGGKTTL